jgi:4-amino-4-deoxy-L-arabinose transferase-like glycosyltransferase
MLIVGLGLVVRAAALAFASDLPAFTHHRLDPQVYDELARRVAAGDLLLGPDVYSISPGYTYVLGLVYWLAGPGPWPIRIVQALLGIASAVLVYLAARRIAGPGWGLAAGLVATSYGPFVFHEQQLLADTWMVGMSALLAWMAVAGAQRNDPRLWFWLVVGLVLGLMADFRATALLLLPALVLAARGWRPIVAVLLGCALAIAPVTLRNKVVAGEAVLVTAHGGFNLYTGNGPDANGVFQIPSDVPGASSSPGGWASFRKVAEQDVGHELTAGEMDRYWYGKTFEHIRKDPGRWARVMVEKAWLAINKREVPNNEDYAFQRMLNPVLAMPMPQFAFIAPIGLAGAALMLRSRRREDRTISLMVLLGLGWLVIFFVLARYRLPVIPPLIVCSAWMGKRLVELARQRRLAPLGLTVAAIAAISVLVLTPKLPKAFDDEWFKLGYAYHVQGRDAEAEHAYAEALLIAPENPSALKNLAVLNESMGRPERARVLWMRLLDIATRRALPEYVETATRRLRAIGAPVH